MVLARFCPFLPTMLKLSSVSMWSLVYGWPCMGEGSSWLPYVLITFQSITLIQIHYSTFCCILSLSLVVKMMFLSVLVAREKTLARIIRVHLIRLKNPTPNKNIGKYNLPHIRDGVLFNTPELRMKNWQEFQEQQTHRTSLVPSRTCRTYKIAQKTSSLRPDEATLHEWWKSFFKQIFFCL